MNTMALTRPAERHGCLLRLTAGPAAAAEARRQVRAALADWQAPVDADVAVLLTSDLVTSALRDQPGTALTLVVRYADGQLRVEVHNTERVLPWPADSRAAPGPGVRLVASLSDEWGRYRTPGGEAAYFTLACHGGRP
jgi:serine/threonine-protein kinase RsbW